MNKSRGELSPGAIPRIAGRVLGVPLMIEASKLRVILEALSPKFQVSIDDLIPLARDGDDKSPHAAEREVRTSESAGHWHRAVIDDDGNGRTTETVGDHEEHVHQITDGDVEETDHDHELIDEEPEANALAGFDPQAAGPGSMGRRPSLQVVGGVAVIDVSGTLVHRGFGALDALSGLTSYESISSQIDDALATSDVSKILLRVDSPGGEVKGVFDLADKIREAKSEKPITAVVNDQATSAAYLLASAASEIVTAQTGILGSIGVVMAHVDETEANDRAGVKVTEIFAGKRKVDLSTNQKLSPEALAAVQGHVDTLFDMFVAAVALNRGLTTEKVAGLEAGLLIGKDAVEAGLADRVGSFESTLDGMLASEQNGGEFTMNAKELDQMDKPDPTKPAAETKPATPAAAAPTAPAATPTPTPEPQGDSNVQNIETARKEGAANAKAIVDTCKLAGHLDRAPGYLEKGASLETVRAELLGEQAGSEEEIDTQSHATGDAGTGEPKGEAGKGVMFAACEKIATRMETEYKASRGL